MNLRATPARPSSSTRCAPRSASARVRSRAGTPPTCSGYALRSLLDRNDVDPADIDDVVGGCVTQAGEQGCNVTRNAWVAAGLPWHVPATSVDRQCGSSQQAMHFVAQGVIAGAYDLAIACGVESMTRAPMSSNARGGVGPFSPAFLEACNGVLGIQFWVAQVLADKFGVTREEMDEFALASQRRAADSADSGYFAAEILPVPIGATRTAPRAVVSSRATRGSAATRRSQAWPPCSRHGSRTTSPRPTSPQATRPR